MTMGAPRGDETFSWRTLGPDRIRVRTYYGAEREDWRPGSGFAQRGFEDRRYWLAYYAQRGADGLHLSLPRAVVNDYGDLVAA